MLRGLAVGWLRAPNVFVRDGLGAELAEQETGQLQARRVEQAGVGLGGLGECPPPALAVVLGLLKALGNTVIDRRAVGLDRAPRSAGRPKMAYGFSS